MAVATCLGTGVGPLREKAPETHFAIPQCSDIGTESEDFDLWAYFPLQIEYSGYPDIVLCQSKWLLREDFQISLIAISSQWWSGSFFPSSCLYQCQWNESKAPYSPKLERNQIWILKNQLNVLQPIVHIWFVQSGNWLIKSQLILLLVIIQSWTYQKVFLQTHKITFQVWSFKIGQNQKVIFFNSYFFYEEIFPSYVTIIDYSDY